MMSRLLRRLIAQSAFGDSEDCSQFGQQHGPVCDLLQIAGPQVDLPPEVIRGEQQAAAVHDAPA
jgi:hypothetical protein